MKHTKANSFMGHKVKQNRNSGYVTLNSHSGFKDYNRLINDTYHHIIMNALHFLRPIVLRTKMSQKIKVGFGNGSVTVKMYYKRTYENRLIPTSVLPYAFLTKYGGVSVRINYKPLEFKNIIAVIGRQFQAQEEQQ